jgi:hypothetical protein
MNTIDWVLVGTFLVLMGAAGYFAFPPYGVILGVGMAGILVYRVKKNRDNLRKGRNGVER